MAIVERRHRSQRDQAKKPTSLDMILLLLLFSIAVVPSP